MNHNTILGGKKEEKRVKYREGGREKGIKRK